MKPRAYRDYLLAVLLAIYAMNCADRLAIGMSLQSIKIALHLRDAELGLLTGIAFAALYAIIGIPIARWTDRGNRVTVIGLTAAAWSIMVVLTGRATTFTQLLLARIGVGIGDAGPISAAQSLIPDHFNRAERPRATAVFVLGWPIALLVGYLIAGWLTEVFGWRAMFMMIGLPGLALAALAWLTLKEPRLERAEMESTVTDRPTWREVWATLWGNRTYCHLLMCFAVSSLFNAGMLQWQPAFFMRSFGLKSGAVGTGLALALGTGSLISIYAGGALASRYAANREGVQFKVMVAAYLFCGVDHALAYLSSSAYLSLALLGMGALLNIGSGPLFAAIQSLVPPKMRAMSYAILMLFCNLIGLGLGPLAAGALSDALHPAIGQESLRYALLALCPGLAWAAWHMWKASNSVMQDMELARLRLDEAADGPRC